MPPQRASAAENCAAKVRVTPRKISSATNCIPAVESGNIARNKRSMIIETGGNVCVGRAAGAPDEKSGNGIFGNVHCSANSGTALSNPKTMKRAKPPR